MKELIELEAKGKDGKMLRAVFNVFKGLNLMSYRQNGLEVIDQSTRNQFEERCAGLGAIIGPHFHHQKDELLPKKMPDESLFPHIKIIKQKGIKDPFSHGIARYVPWKIERITKKNFFATLSSKDSYKGIFLKDLEGTNFEMQYEAMLDEEGLHLQLSVDADREAVVGFHFYYAIENESAIVHSKVQNEYNDMGIFKSIPFEWWAKQKGLHELEFRLDHEADYGFLHYPDPHEGVICLQTQDHMVNIQAHSETTENSWQLYHPKNASFACIEPLSVKNPRRLDTKKSQIQADISIQS